MRIILLAKMRELRSVRWVSTTSGSPIAISIRSATLA